MSSRMWEVDPETRSKLLAIQKQDGNDRCADCGAPSPQWATPKFGIFICLNCAGIHRGLGVHISFVRSITMDGFKVHEVARMEQSGGNDAWKAFFDGHEMNKAEGRTFDDSTIQERYSGLVGEEWKERLAAKVEGRKYVPPSSEELLQRKKKAAAAAAGAGAGAGAASSGNNIESSRSATPARSSASSHTGSPNLMSSGGGGGGGGAGSTRLGGRSNESFGNTPMSRKQANEAYFARMGAQNAQRPEGLSPAQGGKYSGFGGGMPVEARSGRSESGGAGLPGFDSLQQDPMAALTKGFGWFTSTIGKSAKQVHEGYLQPAAKSFAASDFAAQARTVAQQGFQNIQTGARGAATQFNRFVEGSTDEHPANHQSTSYSSISPQRTPIDQQNRGNGYNNSFSSLSSDDPFGPSTTTTNTTNTTTAAAAAERRRNQSMSPSRIGVGSPGGGSSGSGSIGTTAMRNRGGQSGASSATLSDKKSKTGAGSSWKNDDGWDDDW